jgi:OmpA-OmpF porin, OOP family
MAIATVACGAYLKFALFGAIAVSMSSASAARSDPKLIFFGHDSIAPGDSLKPIVNYVIALHKPYRSPLEVSGHADRSGPEHYNLELSRRRALVVKEALVQAGYPLELITVVAHGETRLLKETRDGVREPANRHVAILP